MTSCRAIYSIDDGHWPAARPFLGPTNTRQSANAGMRPQVYELYKLGMPSSVPLLPDFLN